MLKDSRLSIWSRTRKIHKFFNLIALTKEANYQSR